ncbi:MAG: GAF domain-containing protein [Candidatus Krumholzibacteria bacterium]|nr:GAF domain-containing protein [Candidatus Krumholzibacteria bacterium]
MIRCGILGGLEKDLAVLSELHRQEEVQIAFVYEPKKGAVGLEIAEILGIPRCRRPEDLSSFANMDYVVVSEPRARFKNELVAIARTKTQILTPSEAIKRLCTHLPQRRAARVRETVDPYTIEDTLVALEKLLDRKELLKFLLEVAVKATSSSAGSIMLYSQDPRELYIAYAIGLSERVIKNTRQKLGEGIAGTVALSKKAQLIRLPADKSLYARDRERMDIASAISVPLMWREKLLGVLNVSSGQADREHNAKDLEQLKTLSRRLSRVLFESLKLQEVQMRHRESRFRTTMGEIAEKDISSQEKFCVLSRYLAEIMGADTVEIFMNTSEGDWLVMGGSNRLLTPRAERLRFQKGALSRAFVEARCIVMTESSDPELDSLSPLSSVVYCHLALKDFSGVIVLEFSDRSKLDEFMLAKEEIVAEISRFASSEMRERKLRRKLESLGKISDAAPTLLGCRSIDDLGNVITRIVADVLECHRVSVRLRRSLHDDNMRLSYILPPGESEATWQSEDQTRFDKLVETRKPFSMAFLEFDSAVHEGPWEHHSLLALPICTPEVFYGGIIAYSKHPRDPLEDAVFTSLDQSILDNLNRFILPILDAVYNQGPVEEPPEEYESQLQDNHDRFKKLCGSEISRSNRYHHSFALILFRIKPLDALFDKDHEKALSLVGEITQGIRTRTRKTDYGCWIGRSTYAVISLEGGRRIRFLISRAMLYLKKDLSQLTDTPVEGQDVLVGTALYPGAAKSAEDLLGEAEKDLKPFADE